MTAFLWLTFVCAIFCLFVHFNAIANPVGYAERHKNNGYIGAVIFNLIFAGGIIYWEAYLLFITATQYSQGHYALLWTSFILSCLMAVKLLFCLLVPQLNAFVITNRSWLFFRCLIDLTYALWTMYLIVFG